MRDGSGYLFHEYAILLLGARVMRTTVSIDDDLLAVARNMAEARSVSLGKVISELMRQGLATATVPEVRNGFPLFQVSRNARPITLEDVKKAEDDI